MTYSVFLYFLFAYVFIVGSISTLFEDISSGKGLSDIGWFGIINIVMIFMAVYGWIKSLNKK